MSLSKTVGKIIHNKVALIRGSSIKAKSSRGALLFGFGTVADRGLRLVRNMILARILSPNEFGLMAIIMIVPMLFEVLSDVGIRHSVIQNKRGSDREYLNVAWWVQAVQSLVFFLIGVFFAPFISFFYNKPELLNLLRVAFLSILFRGLISPRMSVLWKEYKYGRVVLLLQGSGIIGTFIAIGVAFVMRNVWALVVGFVADAAILCLLSYVLVPFLPRFGIDKESLFELMRFVLGLFGSPVLGLIVLQTDIVVLGKMIVGERLGMYSLAVQLAYLPVILFDRIIRPVLLPAFSEKQDDKDSLCRAILMVSRVGAILGIPFVTFMASCADGILLLAYGPKFVAVAVPFAVLSACALIRMQSGILVPAYLALGRTHLHRRLIALKAAIVVSLMYPAIAIFDLLGAVSVVLLAHMIVLCFQVFFMKKFIGLQFLEYARCWLPGVFACGIVLGSVVLTQVFGIKSVVCNMAIVGLSCVVACALATFSLKYNTLTAFRSGRNIERLESLSSE